MTRPDTDLQGVAYKVGRLQSTSIQTQEVCGIYPLLIGVRR